MADDHDDDAFSFGEFMFASPPQPSTSNGGTPFNLGPGKFKKPGGALPLSLFGEADEESKDFDHNNEDDGDGNKKDQLNGWFDPTQNGKFRGGHQESESGHGLGFDFGGSGLFLSSGDHNDSNSNNNNGDEGDDDEWEFKGAFDEKGGVEGNSQGGLLVGGSKSDQPTVVMPPEKQAGQDASNSVEHEPAFTSYLPQPNDRFAASHGGANKSSEKDVGFKSTATTSYDFMWGAFSKVGGNGNGSGRSVSAANSADDKPGFSSSFPQSDDFLTVSQEAVNKPSKMDVGFQPTSVTSNSFTWDAFSGLKEVSGGVGTSSTAALPVENKPPASSSLPSHNSSSPRMIASDDLFATINGAVNNSSKIDVGFSLISATANGLMFDAFPEVQEMGDRNESNAAPAAASTSVNEDDDFDDFGDFVDASLEVGSKEQEDKQTELQTGRGALPLSLFSDATEEPSESLSHPDESGHKPTSDPGNRFSLQGSAVSIHDLLSNLYNQSQNTPAAASAEQPAENGAHYPQEEKVSALLSVDDDWDDNSWEFKGASSEIGVKEQPSISSSQTTAQKQPQTSQNLQNYIDFYSELRDSLCFLLSCQLDELKKARSLDTGMGYEENTEAHDYAIQEAQKLLEESMVSKEALSKKHLEKSSCLNEAVEILQGPKFEVIELEYKLSNKLQLAVRDWKIATELLRHAISMLKSLSLGSAGEHFHYASTWSKIIDVCAQELRYGASIWKRASDEKVQHELFSDCRGQKNVHALGEIYKAVELLGLSAKVYKAWLLLSNPSTFMDVLDECDSLWSSSGLKEFLQKMSENVDSGCDETVKTLIVSISNIRNLDVLAVHDCVFGQHKSVCRLSLLPPEMLPDMKTVLWNGEPYFLNLANLWANLISCDPPQLPHLQAI